jgi:archaellum component FlaC
MCKAIGDMVKENEALKQRIKRLEAAGDALANNHNPFTFIDWHKAKEAKL